MRFSLKKMTYSMPVRLALGLVALFSMVSLLSLAASFSMTRASLEAAMRAELAQNMAGFRAAPSQNALAALVDAEASETDPERLILSYISPGFQHFGNAPVAKTGDGYHILYDVQGRPRISGRYLALTAEIWGGQLTVARSLADIENVKNVFLNILVLSLLPAVIFALSGGLYLAQRGARNMAEISGTLDALTSGDLRARVQPTADWSNDLAGIGNKIDQMAQSQEASVEALRQVSSDIAHDLKTPIQRVAVHLNELSNEAGLSPDARAHMDSAQRELDRIVSIFHSLLQISSIESGSPRAGFGDVDLAALCRDLQSVYEPAFSEKGRQLDCDVPPDQRTIVAGDRNLLGQVLANLIENALRHTPANATVTIALKEDAHGVSLIVADDGPGIPQSERELVLRRLYRLDRSRSTPGNGLGLSLVASIAKLHRAKLGLLDNAPGLSVQLTFPTTAAV